MADVISDLRLAGILVVFIYLVQWGIGMTGSRKVGILLAIIVTFLTIYQHFILLVLVVFFFFGYAWWLGFEDVWEK